jgi:oxygen-independent coproporphyrinogen-3 oxidase
VTPEFLYVHVPFCVRRCSYCDFAVTVASEPPVRAWLAAIEQELIGALRTHGWDGLRLRTIYVGGGTPSLLGAGAMDALAQMLARYAHIAPDVEWTAEANPESLTEGLARDWAAAGVNRISLGAQTFHEPALRWMGRMHGPDGPARALDAARGAGLENVSLDLIFGLPARLERDWAADVERTLALAPTHVSLYGLTAETNTPLGGWVSAGREHLADEDAYAAEYLLAAERLPAAGYAHYEVSNFARPGLASRHNAAYWDGAAYLGLGPGAHSFAAGERWWNERDWMRYRERVAAAGDARAGAETVGPAERALEQVWLGLRTATGIDTTTASESQQALLALWQREGWALRDGPRVRLTPRGWLLLDRLTVELDAAA